MSGGDSTEIGGHTVGCMELLEEVRVNITDERVSETLTVGDELILSKEEGASVIVAVRTIILNELVGTISGIKIHDILDCLNKGYDLRGIVVIINGGKLIIEVRCVGKKS